jgi:hypothetical protein
MQTPQTQTPLDAPSNPKGAIQLDIDDAVENVRKAAYWFFGIAALSLVNSFLISRGAYFVIGLAMTQLIDSVMIMTTGEVNFFVSLIAPAIFIVIGYYGAHLKRWAFIVGGALYFIDTVLYIGLWQLLPLVFHLFILYKLYRGYQTISEYESLSSQLDDADYDKLSKNLVEDEK